MVKVQTSGDTIYVAVISTDTTEDVIFDIFVRGHDVSVPFGTPQYSVGSPGDAKGSFTVGATSLQGDNLEPYSSQGPTTDERLKPDISAPAGVSGATYGSFGFDGTSASTPHVAASAALVWQAYPEFTRQEVIDFLINSSIDYGASGPDTGFGFGRLQLPSPDNIVGPSTTPIAQEPTATATSDVPSPTATSGQLGSEIKPEPTSTHAPEPTTTPVAFATLEPEYPVAGNQVTRAAFLGVVILGPGCGGAALILLGVVTMLRTHKPRSRGQLYPGSSVPQQVDVNYPASPSPIHHESQNPQQILHSKRDSQVAKNQSSSARKQQETIQERIQKICPNCGAPQKVQARFCRICGTNLITSQSPCICSHCGTETQTRSRFCPKCGKPL
jgi:ribosomal protein L40E